MTVVALCTLQPTDSRCPETLGRRVFACSGVGSTAELDPQRLITTTAAAYLADVSVQAIVNWRNRGHLPVAERDEHGRPKYRLLDVVKCEAARRSL